MQVRLRIADAGSGSRAIEIAAASEADAVRQAMARGARVLAVEAASAPASTASSGRYRFPLLLFSQELLALLEAGLNLAEAIETLHLKERQGNTRSIIDEVLARLREGKSLSDTLARLPQHFPDVYVATVRASERTGNLPMALRRYIAYQVQLDGLRKRLVSAAIYPAMLLTVGLFVMFFLLGYVVPKFSMVYESSGRDLPWLSLALVSFGKAVHAHWVWVLMFAVAGLAAAAYAVAQPAFRQTLLDLLMRLPFFANKAEEFRLARFYRAQGLLLAAGIPLTRGLEMVSGLLTTAQQERLAVARRKVQEGQTLSAALVGCGLAGPVAESLIRVGESSGRLAEMLERTAAFQDDDFSRWIDWATRLLEPMLMTAIGLVIGVVVVLMYIPIFELAGSLQ